MHERAANAVRSLAPRSVAERGEGWGEGQFVAPLTRTRLLVESLALSPLRGARARAAFVHITRPRMRQVCLPRRRVPQQFRAAPPLAPVPSHPAAASARAAPRRACR